MPKLFEPWSLGGLTLPNRIVVAPMCQYSATEGCAGDWHLVHLGQLAQSGAGLLILEATAVSPEGRITPGDLGLYDEASEAALREVLTRVRALLPRPPAFALQIAHAGRKASSHAPWDGGGQIRPDQPGGWLAEAPSALAHGEGELPPAALDAAGLARVREAFAATARRAAAIGIEGLEIHAAHGYLLHQFLSPLANQRSDAYGGSLENRMRFPLEVFEAVRAAFPAERPVWVRVSATDWVDATDGAAGVDGAPGGWDLPSTLALGEALAARGCAALHVSSGGVSARQRIPVGPGYQLPLAQAVREALHARTGMPVIAVGLITEPGQAEAALQAGQADAIALARALLYQPHWPWQAAAQLGAQVEAPRQYWRSAPRGAGGPEGLYKGARFGQR